MTETMDTSRGARLPRSARRKQLLAAAQEVFVT
ncbi:MAG: TetR/AcrR family transcriptional regulator, partial [Jatrophihabitantaceae bacterium]